MALILKMSQIKFILIKNLPFLRLNLFQFFGCWCWISYTIGNSGYTGAVFCVQFIDWMSTMNANVSFLCCHHNVNTFNLLTICCDCKCVSFFAAIKVHLSKLEVFSFHFVVFFITLCLHLIFFLVWHFELIGMTWHKLSNVLLMSNVLNAFGNLAYSMVESALTKFHQNVFFFRF